VVNWAEVQLVLCFRVFVFLCFRAFVLLPFWVLAVEQGTFARQSTSLQLVLALLRWRKANS
jgi:hypothetical protein